MVSLYGYIDLILDDISEEIAVEWKVRAIRGATTAAKNTKEEITVVVEELLDHLKERNELAPEEIVSVIFTMTPDLDAIFPAAIARLYLGWDKVPLLDMQQMQVKGSLKQCIRVLIHLNTTKPQNEMKHSYLRGAQDLR